MEYIQGEKFKTLSDNNKIFYCHTHDVNNFLNNINFDHEFILISHNSDGKITNNPNMSDADIKYMPKNLKRWYAQNICVNHEKLISLPIGLENSEWFKNIKKIEKMSQKTSELKNMKNLVYMNHNIQTNPTERLKPYLHLQNTTWTTTSKGLNGFDFDTYLNNIYNHKFVICPEGNGTDTHRTWECLYLNTIPIEKRNINNSYYTDLPICYIDEWTDINEHFLNDEYIRITNNVYNLDKLDFNYWKNKIISDI